MLAGKFGHCHVYCKNKNYAGILFLTSSGCYAVKPTLHMISYALSTLYHVCFKSALVRGVDGRLIHVLSCSCSSLISVAEIPVAGEGGAEDFSFIRYV